MTQNKLTRREFINYILGGGLLAFLASAIYPVFRYVMPPRGAETDVSSVIAARVGELLPNSSKIFKFGDKPGLLVNTAGGELVAFSAVCPHLNCTVQYNPQDRYILCPCHNGHFDLTGKVISGPPPRSLEKYAVNTRGQDIVVSKNV